VNREAIYAKHRAKYLAERVRAIKPMSPEPSAQLEMIFDRAKDPLRARDTQPAGQYRRQS
jgi:hypothetical protein